MLISSVLICYLATESAYYIYGFPHGSLVRNLSANAGYTGEAGSVPGSGRSSGGGKRQHTPKFLPEKFHGQEEPGELLSMGLQRVGHD